MTQISHHIRKFLEDSFKNENNGLINSETIIYVNKKYNLNLNIDYKEPYDNDEIIPRMFRYNCLDQIIFNEIFKNINLPFGIIKNIINERIEINDNNIFKFKIIKQ